MPVTPGSRLGCSEIVSALGAGGMGEVYKARDTRLDRTVAIKVLPEAFAHDPERLARFERDLVQTMFDERNGEISPDGRWLAYESDESGQSQIYVRPFPDVEQGRWQVSTSGGVQPLWARSGRELFYLAPDGTLMGVPVDAQGDRSFAAGTPATLMAGAGYSAGLAAQFSRTYDVSPDGKRFLRIKPSTSSADDTRPDLIVVQSWFEELKRLVPAP